jgi:hypothetical protein
MKNPINQSMFAGYDGPIIDPATARKIARARRLLQRMDKKEQR